MKFEFMKEFRAKPNESLWEHTEKLIKNARKLLEFGYITEDVLAKLIMACRYHDIGKMNKEFQERIRTGSKFDAGKEVGHNLLSGFLVDVEGVLSNEDYEKIVYVVLNHHHYHENNFSAIDEKRELLYEKQNEVLDILKKIGIDVKREERLEGRALKSIKSQENKLETRLLKGLLHKCDYAASSGIEIEFKNDFLEEQFDKYIRKKNFKLNDMQKFCREHRDDNILITASTGMGKTEAAMLWLGNNKGIYVLPLKTAINEIYKRIKDEILQEENINNHIGLLHGDTFPIYMEQLVEGNEKIDELEYKKTTRYFYETKNLSLPITISTPDQIFNFVYHYNGYELKLANLSYSKVIIDEIQAYSADLLAYLIFGLQSIVRAGGKFAIFTATFPPFIKDLLGKTFNKNTYEEKELEIRGEHLIDEKYATEINRHHLKITESELKADDIKETYERKENKKILVVCNTVKEAQRIFRELSDDCNCRLLHSKFISQDRKKKEHQIMEDGKTFCEGISDLNDKKIIWISTQIVEASLDIDFDYLFTEVVNLNSLFQRLGRVNRKGCKLIENPNCFIYTDINESLFLTKEKGVVSGFIDKTLHEMSIEAIKKQNDGIISEEDKQELIDVYFTYEKIRNSQFIDDYKYFYDKVSNGYHSCQNLNDVKKTFRNIISYKAIPREIFDELYTAEIDDIIISMQDIEDKIKKCYENGESVLDNLKIEKMKLKQRLNSYCFQANQVEIKGAQKVAFGDEEIYIVEGSYSEKIGFERSKPHNNKNEESFIL